MHEDTQRRALPALLSELFQRRLVSIDSAKSFFGLQVLLFQRSQTLRVRYLHAAIFGLPVVQRGFRSAHSLEFRAGLNVLLKA